MVCIMNKNISSGTKKKTYQVKKKLDQMSCIVVGVDIGWLWSVLGQKIQNRGKSKGRISHPFPSVDTIGLGRWRFRRVGGWVGLVLEQTKNLVLESLKNKNFRTYRQNINKSNSRKKKHHTLYKKHHSFNKKLQSFTVFCYSRRKRRKLEEI